MVALGGDEGQIVHRTQDNPITYPEMLVLTYLHGENAVSDAYALGSIERENMDELERLRVTYGKLAITDVFPGIKPRLPAQDTRIKSRTAPTAPKRKPLPARQEELEDDGEGVPRARELVSDDGE
jgi:hypothetical protein